ncbi:TspO and MBR related proteins [Allokutzneria albata]|uniref:TspO and MBR related proteins n=1 Tax=Allokutzneria albata TaxID=211114 RepID=A0A1G9VLA8_ALLAB|nr:TspO and MBR related proteins [Allokutzneria albata]
MLKAVRTPSSPVAPAAFGIAVAVVAVVGATASGDAATTYTALRQPAWAPPSWLFGPVWTVLYVLLALSGWLYWRNGGTKAGLITYAVGLALNAAWSPLFFGAGLRTVALVDIIALDIVVMVGIWLFSRRSRAAALLQIPYLAWIVFATALNMALVVLN